jgi:hypothetical protein
VLKVADLLCPYSQSEARMTRRFCFSLSLIALASACTAAIRNTPGATEAALMQSDRDFAVEATRAESRAGCRSLRPTPFAFAIAATW